MSVQRWQFQNIKTGEVFIVPLNPNEMTSPYPPRNFSYKTTTAGPAGGRAVTYESYAGTQDWSFGGTILDEAHYKALLAWSYVPGKVQITDHLGRVFVVVFKQFEVTPKRSYQHAWYSEYTMHATVYWATPTGPMRL